MEGSGSVGAHASPAEPTPRPERKAGEGGKRKPVTRELEGRSRRAGSRYWNGRCSRRRHWPLFASLPIRKSREPL